MRRVGLGHDQQAAGVLVDAVHDAGPFHATDTRQRVTTMKHQRIDQRARRCAGGRVHHQAGRLVDHDQIVILVHDRQRDILGLQMTVLGLGHSHIDHRPFGHARLGVRGDNAVHLHRAIFQQPREACA